MFRASVYAIDSTYQFTTTIDEDQVNLEILDPGPEVRKTTNRQNQSKR